MHPPSPSNVQNLGIMHGFRGFTSGTQWTSSSLSHLSFIPYPWSWCADLGTTRRSGHSMPSTHPSRMRLVGWWVSHPSMLSSSKSFSHSNGVSSARADWVETLMWASSLSHKDMASPCGVASRKSQLWWLTFTLLLKSFISYEGTPFATWHTTSYSTHSNNLSPSFFLEMCQASSESCLPASVELCS